MSPQRIRMLVPDERTLLFQPCALHDAQASAGALERMEVHTCASMPRALSQAVSHGWHVIGAASALILSALLFRVC